MIRRSLFLTLAVLALTAHSAAAADVHASPDATRIAAPCTVDEPCRLDAALTIATLGDSVIMSPGEYFQSGSDPWPILPSVKTGVVAQGGVPTEPPVIHGLVTANATPFVLVESGGTLQDVEIEMSAVPAVSISYAVNLRDGALLNRAKVTATDTTGVLLTACLTGGGTIRNSACLVSGPAPNRALQNSFGGNNLVTDVINTTAISTSPAGFGMRVGMSTNHTSTMNISNSIARGGMADLGTGTFTGLPPTGTAVINVHHSNWNTYQANGNGTNQIFTGAGNQTGATAAVPLFVDAAAGDYRQLPASPTIDAGLAAAAPDRLTIGGTVRVFGPAPDIGAYEFTRPPVPTTRPATGIGPGRAVLNGMVDPAGSDTNAVFEFGKTTAYGQTTYLPMIKGSDPETPMSAEVSGLEPNTTYHYRVTATSEGGGSASGEDMTFTTSPGTIPGEALTISGLKAKKKWRLRKGATVRFTLSRAAKVRLLFDIRKGKKSYVRRGVKVVNGVAGVNRIRIGKKLRKGKKLKPGRYRLKAVAVGSDGTKAVSKKVRFRIRR